MSGNRQRHHDFYICHLHFWRWSLESLRCTTSYLCSQNYKHVSDFQSKLRQVGHSSRGNFTSYDVQIVTDVWYNQMYKPQVNNRSSFQSDLQKGLCRAPGPLKTRPLSKSVVSSHLSSTMSPVMSQYKASAVIQHNVPHTSDNSADHGREPSKG